MTFNVKVSITGTEESVDLEYKPVARFLTLNKARKVMKFLWNFQVECAQCDELRFFNEDVFQCDKCDEWFCDDHAVSANDGEFCESCAKDLGIITDVEEVEAMFEELFINTEDRNDRNWPDYPGRREAWNDWLDNLHRDNQVSDEVADCGLPDRWDD